MAEDAVRLNRDIERLALRLSASSRDPADRGSGEGSKMINSAIETKPSGRFWFYFTVRSIRYWIVALWMALNFKTKGNEPCEPLV